MTWRLPRPGTAIVAFLIAWAISSVLLWAYLRFGAGDDAGPVVRSLLHLWSGLPIVFPVAAIVVNVRRHFGLTSPLGSSLLLFLAGMLCWSLGNAVWFWYQTCSAWALGECSADVQIPFPSPADVLYLAVYPLSVAGGVQFARAITLPWRAAAPFVPPALLLAGATAYLGMPGTTIAGVPVGLGLLISNEATTSEVALTSAYVLGDVAMVIMVSLLLACTRGVAQGLFRRPLLLLAGGMTFLFAADLRFFHALASDNYDDVGADTLLYGAAVVLTTYAIHRFTRVPRRLGAVDSDGALDTYHRAAYAIIETQSRMIGDLAWQVAAGTPGVVIDGRHVVLQLPCEQSLARLVDRFHDRTGPFGSTILLQALTEVATAAGDGALDDVLAHTEAAERRRAAPRSHRSRLAAATIVIAAGAGVLGAAIDHHAPWESALTHSVPVVLIAICFGIAARRRQLDHVTRQEQLDRANGSLAALLDGFDAARADERRRIAGEIHDFALQQLVASLMHLERAAGSAHDDRREQAITRTRDLVSGSIAELRRIMDGLEPSSLFHHDLSAALEELASQVQAAHSVRVNLGAVDMRDLALNQQLLVYRSIAEMVTNAGKHSGGTTVTVRAERRPGALDLLVADDGYGFDEQPLVLEDAVPPGRGWGLQLLLEHVLQAGGHLRLESGPAGTRVHVTLPLDGGVSGAAQPAA